MHEASIAQSLIEEVERALEQQGVEGRVAVIHLEIGRLSSVVPDYLRFIFGVVAEGTRCEGAELAIREIPIRARCPACGAEDEVTEAFFLCPRCGSPDLELLSGRELRIVSLEVDEPAPRAEEERHVS